MADKNPGKMAAFLGSFGRKSTTPRRARGLFDFLAPKTDTDTNGAQPGSSSASGSGSKPAAAPSSKPPAAEAARRSETNVSTATASASGDHQRRPMLHSDGNGSQEKTRMPIIAETSHPNLLANLLLGINIDETENHNPDLPAKHRPLHKHSESKHSAGKYSHGGSSASHKSRHQTIAGAHSAPSRRTPLSTSTNGSTVDTTARRRTRSKAASSVDVNRYGSTPSSLDINRFEPSIDNDHLDFKILAENRPASVPSVSRYSHIIYSHNKHIPIEIYIRAAGTNEFISAHKHDLVAVSPVLRDRIANLDGGRILDLAHLSHFVIVRIIDWAVLQQFSFTATDTSQIANPAYDLYAAATELQITDLRAKMRREFAALFPDLGPCHWTCIEYLRVLHRFFVHATADPKEHNELLTLVQKAVNRFSFSEIAHAASDMPWETSPGAQMYRYLILAKGDKDDANPAPPPAATTQPNTASLPVHHAEFDRYLDVPPVMFARTRESPRFRGEWRTSLTSAVVSDRRRRGSHA
ncbi:hypothetical protein TWF696_003521 [Orbilia brochopaga]|uniref:BTB domain-containing protein n=1 Tax=Orbilia brochopaga TaxID=3140254 RepID=A0AAV9TWR5_9PEZI